MVDSKDKGWLVEYPGLEFDREFEVAFGETRNKIKYLYVGAGDDAEWNDIRVVRAKDLDGMSDRWDSDTRFRDLWWLNNGNLIDSWETETGEDYNFHYYKSADEIKEELVIDYGVPLTYEDVDIYVRKLSVQEQLKQHVESWY